MKKRALSWLLAVVMVVSLAPQTIPWAKAADPTSTPASQAKNAFGLTMEEKEAITEGAKLKNNPYGTTAWIPLFQDHELVVAGVHDDEFQTTYTGGADGKGSQMSSFRWGHGKYKIGNARRLVNVAFDPYGTGRDEYIATLAFDDDADRLSLYVTNKDRNVVSAIDLCNDDAAFINKLKFYQTRAMLCIEAGDFDGDGKDTLMVYTPGSASQDDRIKEYSFNGSLHYQREINLGGFMAEGVHRAILEKHQGDNNDELRAHLSVDMAVGDVDMDGVEELAITVNVNDLPKKNYKGQEGLEKSYLAVYDYADVWKQSEKWDLGSGKDRARFAGVTIGYVNAAPATGTAPSVVAVGYKDKNSDNKNCDLDTGKYRVYSYTYTKSGWQNQNNGTELNANGFTNTGTKGDDNQNPLAVAAVSADGAMTQEYLFVSGTMYKLGSGSDQVGNTDYPKNRGINGYIINNTGILDYAVGNFDGNKQGREQVYYVEYHKQETFDKEFLRIGQLYKEDVVSGETHTASEQFKRWTDGWTYYGKKNCNVAITVADVNNDAVLAKIEEISYGYNDPKIMAILEASPHFSELNDGDIGNSETSFGRSKSESINAETSGSFGFDVMAGFEYVAPVIETGGGIEFNTSHTFTFGNLTEKTKTVEVQYSNDTNESQVVMYATPMTYYKYRVKNPDDGSAQAESTMYLAVAGQPATNMVTVEEYNQAAASYNMDLIGEGVLGSPGKPNTYRSNLPNATAQSWEYPGDTSWGNYSGSATTTQNITDENGEGKSFSYEYEGSVQAYGIVGGFKAGGGVHWGASTSKETMTTEGITKAGTVTGGGNKNYDFNWKFATWTTHLNGADVPILGYLVKNVKAPPSPAQDLVLSDQSTTTMKLSWEEGDRPADYYKIWRKTQEGTGVNYTIVAQISAASENGSYEYELTGLFPNQQYEYVITSGSYTTGLESVYSESVIGRTLSGELTHPEITVTPAAPSGELGDTVTLSVSTVLHSYRQQTLQWQERLAGDRWRNIDGATGKNCTIAVTNDRIGAKYRCVVMAQTTAADRVPFYSDAVSLRVGTPNTTILMGISGATGGNGAESTPYIGQSDYDAVTRTVTKVDVTNPVTVQNGGDTLVVYQAAEGRYVGIKNAGSDNAEYYALTQNGDTYTVGAKLMLSEATTYKYLEGGTAVTLPTDRYDPEKPKDSDLQTITGQTEKGIETIKVDLSATGDAQTNYITPGFAYLDGEIYNTSTGNKVTTDTDKYYQLYGQSMGTGEDNKDTFFVSQTVKVAQSDPDSESISYENVVHYYLITLVKGEDDKVTDITSKEITPTTTQTLSGEGFADVTNPTFTAVQTTTKKDVTIEDRVPTSGTGIQLNITTTREDTSAKLGNVPYTVTIVNTTTGAVSTLSGTTNADGEASRTWRAPVSGLYAITTATASGVAAKSDTLYYLAGIREVVKDDPAPTETVYTLSAPVTMTYGETANISLYQQQMTKDGAVISSSKTEVTATDGVSYTARLTGGTAEQAISASFKPDTAGSYLITAYSMENGEKVKRATTSITVERANLTLKPVWGTGDSCDPNSAPTAIRDITVKATSGLVSTDDGLLDAVKVSCGLYRADGNINDSLSGRYDVALSVDTKHAKAADLLKKYNITMESGMLIRVQSTGPVKYKAGENGTLDARYSADYNQQFESGASIPIGEQLSFVAEPKDSGYKVGEWKINGKTLAEFDPTGTRYELKNTQKGKQLVIRQFQQNDLDSTTKALTVEVSFVSAAHTITYLVDGGTDGGGTITAESSGQKVASGQTVADGASVTFTAAPADGKAVKHWMVDNKTYTWPDTTNPYRENTLTLTDVKNAHTVSVAFEDAQSSTVTANVETETGVSETSLTLSAKRGEQEVDLNAPENAPIGSVIHFTLSGTGLGHNITVKEWKVDGKIVTGSGGKDSFDLYVTKGSHTVTAVVAVAQHYTVTFANAMDGETPTATVTAKSNGTGVVSGDRIAAYLPIEFTAEVNENYYVTGWTGATQDKTNPNKATISSLSSNETVSVQTAEKPKVEVTSLTPTNGSYSVVGTRSGQDVIFTNENVGTELNPHVDHESKVTITATPKEGYYVKSIKIVADNVSTTLMEETSKETYQSGTVTEEIPSVTQDTVIDIKYAAKPTVTITNNDNVTITAEQGGKPLSGKWVEKYSGAIKFTAEPTTGYEIDTRNVQGWEKVDSTANDNTVYTQNGPITENVTIDVKTKKIPTYNLTLSVKELGGSTNGGTVSANITRKALSDYNAEITTETGDFYRDSNIEIVPHPEDGYRVQSYTWNVNGTTGSGETIPENLLKNVQGDVQIEVCYVKLGSGISFGPLKEGTGSENGYISAATLTEGEGEKPSVMHKASGLQLTAGGINFTAIPAAGYEVEGWYKTTGSEDTRIDSMGDADDKREFTFTPEDGDTTVYIHPKFRQVEYDVKTAEGVTVSPGLTNGKARGGTALTFTAPGKAGQNVTGWTINGTAVTTGTTGMNGNTLTWTVENGHLSDPAVTSYDVQPTYEKGAYTVRYDQPQNGKLTATATAGDPVAGNTQVTFTAAPDAHYEVDKWTVNNADSTETGNKLTLNITDNTTVAVSFKLKTYSVTLNQTEGGTATASSDETTATALTNITFTATPETGWHFAGWKITGSETSDSSANPLTLKITGNTTVEPVFTKQMFAITTALADGSNAGTIAMTTGGAAVPADGTVPYGTTVTVTVTPENASDMVDTWTVNGDVKSQMTAAADAPLSYDVTVTEDTNVVVKLIDKPQYKVTISATGKGTANIGGVNEVMVGRGDSITATAAANNGSNYLKNWLVNSTETPKNGNTLAVGPVRQDTAIVAVFDELVRQKVMFKNVTEMTNSTSTVAITADGGSIKPGATAEDAALVVGNSKVVFTATVPANEMVGEWTINGVKQDNLSNTLTIDDLRVDTKVTVKFVPYVGYDIPTSTQDYTIEDIVRTPADTEPATQIRAGGTVEFVVKASDAGKSITGIKLNDCGNVTTTPQADGSIKVTVKNVKANIKLTNVTVVSSIPLRITTPSNGTITVKKGGTVLKNGDKVMEADELTITATPNSNYALDTLTVTGAEKQPNGAYKVQTGVTEVTVAATFKSTGGGGGGGGGGGVVSTYTLTFDTNGGSAIDKITKDSGTTIDLAAYKPTRAGYTFAGWFSDKALTKAVTSVKLTANTTVYAKWTQNGGTAENPFVDVKEGAYYYDAVLWAVEQKITSGTSATTFSPDASCTRAQMVTFLWRAAGSPKVENGKNPFTDVKADAYYYDAVLWAVEKGVTSGTSATTFSPDATVTRGQTVTFLYRNAGSPEVSGTMPFTDVEADAYYAKAVQWAVQQKITTGTSETTFSPMSDCTRGQIVTFLYRAK